MKVQTFVVKITYADDHAETASPEEIHDTVENFFYPGSVEVTETTPPMGEAVTPDAG
jgi:hypothetical protein